MGRLYNPKAQRKLQRKNDERKNKWDLEAHLQ